MDSDIAQSFGTHVRVTCKLCFRWSKLLLKSSSDLWSANALHGHLRACPAKIGHIIRQGDTEKGVTGKAVAYSLAGGGPPEDGNEDAQECFELEEMHVTEAHCVVEVQFAPVEQRPPEVVIDELLGNVDPGLHGSGEAVMLQQGDPSTTTKEALMESADKRMYEHQLATIKLLKAPTKMRKGKDLELVLYVYNLGLSLGVSDRKGDMLLRALSVVHNRATRGPSSSLSLEELAFLEKEEEIGNESIEGTEAQLLLGLHENWDSLRLAIEKGLMMLNPVLVLKIPLNPKLFPALGLDKKPLGPVVTYHFNLLDRLADACLDINPTEFFFAPKAEFAKDDDKRRIFSGYSTGIIYEKTHLWTTQEHGPHAVSLMLAIFSDEAAAGKKRKADPMIAYILNAVGKSYVPIFLGFCPTTLPESDHYYGTVLDRSGALKPTKKAKKFAIRFAKRQAKLQFLRAVLAPLKEYEGTGFKLQIGRGTGFVGFVH